VIDPELLLFRLEAGEPIDAVATGLGLQPGQVIAALARAALGGDDSTGPALVQQPPRRPALARALTETALRPLLPSASLPQLLALSAGLLQIHDFWKASHEAAQQADDLGEQQSSAYWHAIAHRREPDLGNSTYWFHRVGRHALFGPLAQGAGPILASAGPAGQKVVASGNWDPFAFIALCDRPAPKIELPARRAQRLEMLLLLEFTERSATDH
jgi:hypothetical protein